MADRVVAGLEVVTPRVVTSDLLVDTVTPATGTDIAVTLGADGQFTVGEASGSANIRFDAFGNATFAGTIEADTIRANQIEGLTVLAGNLIAERIATMSGLFAGQGIRNAPVSGELLGVTSDPSSIFEAFVFEASSGGQVRLTMLSDLTVQGALIATKDALFKGKTVFESLAEFIGDIFFRGRVTFNNDMAGTAVISSSTTSVTVPFEKPFETPPVVTISLVLKDATDSAFMVDGLHAAVANVTTNGFTIVLDLPVPRDLEYNWVALAVTNPRRVVGQGLGVTPASPSGGLTPTPTTYIPQPTASPTPGLTVTPTPGLTVTPTATPVLTPTESPVPTPTPLPPEASAQGGTPINGTLTVVNTAGLGYVRIREGPSTGTAEIGQIPEGETLLFDNVQNGWYRVMYNTINGWISGVYVQVN